MSLRDRLKDTRPPATVATIATVHAPKPPTVATVATVATPPGFLSYSQADIAELDGLIRRWHELARVPGVDDTLAIRQREAPNLVRGDLEAFRAMVRELGATP